MIEQNDMIHDIEVEVHHEINITKNTIHKTDTVLPLEIVFIMTKARSYRSPYRSSYKSPYRHNSRHRYRYRSYSRDNNFT